MSASRLQNRNRRVARWLLGATAAGLYLAGSGSPATASVCAPGFTIRWVAEGTNNLWETPENWADAVTGDHRVPGPTDRVCAEIVGPHFTLVTIDGPAIVRSIEAYLPIGINGSLDVSPQVGDPDSVAHGFLHNTGVLKGPGNIIVEGELTPGTITGPGTITVAPTGSISIGVSVLLDDHRTLVNNGTAGWFAGDITLRNGAVFENAGTITATSDLGILLGAPSPDLPKLHNLAGGTISKTDDIGPQNATTIAVPFDNDGDVDVSDGKIVITGGNPTGETSTGDFGGTGPGIVEFPSGSYTLAAGSHIDGRVDLTGATVAANGTVVDAGAALNVVAGTLNPDGAAVASGGTLALSGGTLSGAGTVTVDGTLDWSSGVLSGTGTTTIGSGGTFAISPGAGKTFVSRTIDSSGTISWGDGDVNSGSGAVIVNRGTLTATADRNLAYNLGGAQPALHNTGTGTIQKTGGTGDTSFPGWLLENDGLITASTGRIVTGPGDGAGIGGSDGASTGDFDANGGTVTIAGTYDVGPGSNFSGVCCVVVTGSINVNGATVDDDAVLHLEGGTLTGTGTLSVEGTLQWTSGTIAGTGTTDIEAGGRLDIVSANGKSLVSRTTTNEGIIDWSGTGSINAGSGAVIENAGTFSLSTDADLAYSLGGVAPTLHNASTGTIRKTAGTLPDFTDISVVIDNDGTFDVDAGKVRLTNGNGVVSTGTFLVDSTTLELAGTFSLASPARFGGTCCVELTGTIDVAGAQVLAGATLRQSGTVTGAGTLTVAGTLEWLSGTMAGAGTTQITPSGTLQITTTAGKTIAQRRLTNSGTATWSGGNINTGSGATVTNNGAFTITGDNDLAYSLGGALPVFRIGPAGTLTKSSTGISHLTAGLDNDGTVEVDAGTLRFGNAAAGNQDGHSEVTGVLEYTGGSHSLVGSVAFSGPGTVRVTAGTVTITGADNAALTEVAGGVLNLDGPGMLADLTVSSGSLGGSGTRTVADDFMWTGGALVGTGTTIVGPVGHLNVSGPDAKTIAGTRLLQNNGTGTWSGGNINTGSGARVRNDGTLTVTGDNSIAYNLGGAAPSFRNLGTLVKTATAGGATEFVLSFENDGVLESTAGPLRLQGGGPESNGDFRASGTGSVELPSGTYSLGAGVNFGGCCTRLNGSTVTLVSGAVPQVDTGATLSMSSGTLTGAGVLRVRGTLVWTGGAMTGSGTGTIDIGSSGTLSIEGAAAKTIAGRAITNAGTLTWSGGAINAGSGASISNSRTFIISGDYGFHYNLGGAQPSVTNSGTIRKTAAGGPGSATEFNGVLFATSGTLDVQAGTLAINGTTATNTGSVMIGQNGILHTSGAFALPAGKTLTIGVAGATPGAGLGRLEAGGAVTINGTLAIQRPSAFKPPLGATFDIITFPSSTGTFSAVTGATFGAKRFDVQYAATKVTLVVVPA